MRPQLFVSPLLCLFLFVSLVPKRAPGPTQKFAQMFTDGRKEGGREGGREERKGLEEVQRKEEKEAKESGLVLHPGMCFSS